jgi:ABC-type lipoprotein release transport system permease subunit
MKDDQLSSPSKSDSPTKKSSRNKRRIPRICGIKVKTFWEIKKQFMSSIYILNGLFLILITIIVLVTTSLSSHNHRSTKLASDTSSSNSRSRK